MTNQASSSFSASRPASAQLSGVLGVRPTQRLPHSTMIGELKFTVLKARLAAVGVQAELIGEGVPVCRGRDDESSVAVRKSARGQVDGGQCLRCVLQSLEGDIWVTCPRLVMTYVIYGDPMCCISSFWVYRTSTIRS